MSTFKLDRKPSLPGDSMTTPGTLTSSPTPPASYQLDSSSSLSFPSASRGVSTPSTDFSAWRRELTSRPLGSSSTLTPSKTSGTPQWASQTSFSGQTFPGRPDLKLDRPSLFNQSSDSSLPRWSSSYSSYSDVLAKPERPQLSLPRFAVSPPTETVRGSETPKGSSSTPKSADRFSRSVLPWSDSTPMSTETATLSTPSNVPWGSISSKSSDTFSKSTAEPSILSRPSNRSSGSGSLTPSTQALQPRLPNSSTPSTPKAEQVIRIRPPSDQLRLPIHSSSTPTTGQTPRHNSGVGAPIPWNVSTSPAAPQDVDNKRNMDAFDDVANWNTTRQVEKSWNVPLPLDVQSLRQRGNELVKENKLNEAIEVYTQAIQLSPQAGVLYGNRSAARLQSGNVAGALEDSLKTTELAPTWVKGHMLCARAYERLGRHAEAAEACAAGSRCCNSNAREAMEMWRMRREFISIGADAALKGCWHGAVNQAMGGDQRELWFDDNGEFTCVVQDQKIKGKYAVQDVPEITIDLGFQGGLDITTGKKTMPFLFKVGESDGQLHLCAASGNNNQRPARFEGSGYFILNRGRLLDVEIRRPDSQDTVKCESRAMQALPCNIADVPVLRMLENHGLLDTSWQVDFTGGGTIESLAATSSYKWNMLIRGIFLGCGLTPAAIVLKGKQFTLGGVFRMCCGFVPWLADLVCTSHFTVKDHHVRPAHHRSGTFFFYGPGTHRIFSRFTKVLRKDVPVTTPFLEHNDRSIVTVKEEHVGVCENAGLPVLLPPGTHSWKNPTMVFQKMVDLSDEVVQLGPYTLLRVARGSVAVTQNNGKRTILSGGRSHLLTHRNWTFTRFAAEKFGSQTECVEPVVSRHEKSPAYSALQEPDLLTTTYRVSSIDDIAVVKPNTSMARSIISKYCWIACGFFPIVYLALRSDSLWSYLDGIANSDNLQGKICTELVSFRSSVRSSDMCKILQHDFVSHVLTEIGSFPSLIWSYIERKTQQDGLLGRACSELVHHTSKLKWSREQAGRHIFSDIGLFCLAVAACIMPVYFQRSSRIEVRDGHLRPASKRGKYFFYGPGIHRVLNPFVRVQPKDVALKEPLIKHGPWTIATIRQGFVGVCENDGQMMLLPPGMHAWNNKDVMFEKEADLSERVVTLGKAAVLLTVVEGHVAVVLHNGMQELLPGGQRHLLLGGEWTFDKFATKAEMLA